MPGDRKPGPGDEERVDTLQAEIDRLSQELVRTREHLRQSALESGRKAAELDRTRRELRMLQHRRSVRLGVVFATRTRSLIRVVRRLVRLPRRLIRSGHRHGGEYLRQRRLRVSPAAEAQLIAALHQEPMSPTVDHGPLVSIVILNRNGRSHIERCLRAVAATAYRDVEVIVVDNGSTDGSVELIEGLSLPFPIRVIRNAENRSFSEANGQGVSVAAGDLICFLNNDVDPITEHWLGYMVETITQTGAAAVGARLIFPRHRGGRRGGRLFADLSLQHAGVMFDRAGAATTRPITTGIPLPIVVGAGDDPLAEAATAVEDRPALTAACLLVEREALEEVGGFTPGYDYGLEDVDLCLKLRAAGGRLVYDGRAALWHFESATRAADRERFRARVTGNRELFIDRWGRRVFREALLDALAGNQRFSKTPFHLAITVTSLDREAGFEDWVTAHEIGDALAGIGWQVSYVQRAGDRWYAPDPVADAILVLLDACDIRRLPRNLITMAWIQSGPERWIERAWFDDYDLVFGSSERMVRLVHDRSAKVASLLPIAASADRAHTIRDALRSWGKAIRYGLRIGVPNWDAVERWGDYHFARDLQRSLERAGHPTRVFFLPDWGEAVAAREDVTVHLFGFKEAPTRSGQVNLLWHISHPDLASIDLYERYDHVFVASDDFASLMAAVVRVPVTALHQATDPERFRPDPTGPPHELLFVANSRNVRRRIVADLAGTSRDLAVYGQGWTPKLIEPRFVKGVSIANADLNRYYSSAAIVLNDHWDDMRAAGFISNRPYDALACGAFVISDHVKGIEEEFDGALVTYGSPSELDPLIARYLADPFERKRLGEHGRQVVLQRHTFDERVRELSAVADLILSSRPARITDAQATSTTPGEVQPVRAVAGLGATVTEARGIEANNALPA